jgi:hypothetical protein
MIIPIVVKGRAYGGAGLRVYRINPSYAAVTPRPRPEHVPRQHPSANLTMKPKPANHGCCTLRAGVT